ncbi:MAG: three-Cys-motif partner protein TcmP [Gammaproteobacteria bacterium]|nr:three-Cys-motif partner protein TcmP [Gammaproteobacteria bacterium]
MSDMEQLESIDDDGLAIPEIGAWGEDKYRLVAYYASLFLSSIRSSWDALVYIDLFAGSGYSKIRGSGRIVAASPMKVLGLSDHFDSYIFCEENDEYAQALRARCAKIHPDRSVLVIPGDANKLVSKILSEMPQPRQGYKVLGFCFLDPYFMRNLKFTTISALSKRFMDFLVLIPSSMDANRNEQNYIRENNTTLDNFLGTTEWRERWKLEKENGQSFEQFVVNEFGRSMESIGYIDPGIESAAPVRSDDKNLLLYRLALYSKHPLANKFWKEAKKYTTPQMGFDF